jgi:hypothetical protein
MHLRISWSIALIVVASAIAYSQEASDKAAPTCGYSELYRKDGWVIPGIKGAKKKWRAAVPDKQGVYMTALEPTERAATIQTFRCSREHTGRLEVEDVDVGVGDLASFDVGGRIFAYNLVYGVDGIAAVTFVRFYDLDGSGRFTLIRGERNRFVPELIPDWVKDNKDDKTK